MTRIEFSAWGSWKVSRISESGWLPWSFLHFGQLHHPTCSDSPPGFLDSSATRATLSPHFVPIIIPCLHIVHRDSFHAGSGFHHVYPVEVRILCNDYTHPTSLQFPTMPHQKVKRARYGLHLACTISFSLLLALFLNVLFLVSSSLNSPSLFSLRSRRPRDVSHSFLCTYFDPSRSLCRRICPFPPSSGLIPLATQRDIEARP